MSNLGFNTKTSVIDEDHRRREYLVSFRHLLTRNIRHGGRPSRHPEILGSLQTRDLDIIVLTEHRASRASFLRALSSIDPDDNSILVLSKHPIEPLDPPSSIEALHRWLECLAPHTDLRLLGIHIPGAGDRWSKEAFWKEVVAYGREHLGSRAVIIGDFNTGLEEDAEGADFKHSGYMRELLDMGWVDAWRAINGDRREFSWYSAAGNGFRVDHAFVSPGLKKGLVNARYSHGEREKGVSDHSVLIVEFTG